MIEQYVDNIKKLDSQAIVELVDQLNKYPYCGSLKLLYSIALANVHSTKLNEQVQQTAVALPDRLKFFQLVSNGEYEWVNLLTEIEQKKIIDTQNSQEDDFALIDRYLENVGENSRTSLPYDISSVSISDYDLDDFGDDLTSNEDEQDALIDSFIEAEQNGVLFVPKADIADSDDLQEEEHFSLSKIREKAFLSESLAKIYVKQHKYEQALAIFSSLNLKYSKKNTYFADQIRYLELILAYQKGEIN